MTEGSTILCTDNKHFVTVLKIVNNQSLIVECSDKQLSFTRLIEYDDIARGIVFGSWIWLLKGR
jgi:hypothetical protein